MAKREVEIEVHKGVVEPQHIRCGLRLVVRDYDQEGNGCRYVRFLWIGIRSNEAVLISKYKVSEKGGRPMR